MKDAFEVEYEKYKLELKCAEAKLNTYLILILIVCFIGYLLVGPL